MYTYLKKHFLSDLLKDLQHLASSSQSRDSLVDQISVRQVDNVTPLHPLKDVVILVEP
jgi:hypothetical protein